MDLKLVGSARTEFRSMGGFTHIIMMYSIWSLFTLNDVYCLSLLDVYGPHLYVMICEHHSVQHYCQPRPTWWHTPGASPWQPRPGCLSTLKRTTWIAKWRHQWAMQFFFVFIKKMKLMKPECIKSLMNVLNAHSFWKCWLHACYTDLKASIFSGPEKISWAILSSNFVFIAVAVCLFATTVLKNSQICIFLGCGHLQLLSFSQYRPPLICI